MKKYTERDSRPLFGITSMNSKAFDSSTKSTDELRKELITVFNDGVATEAVSTFSGDLEGNRHSPEYNFVGFPSKKPYEPIEKYIRHFSKKGDVILDPFCGSGGVALVASQCGRHAICVDASPLACKISQSYTTHIEPKDIDRAFTILDGMLKKNREKLYSTTCHLSKQRVEIDAIVWTETTRCIKCFELIAIADLREKACPKCGNLVKTRYERLGCIPWGALYKSPGHGEVLRTASGSDHEAKLAFNKFDFPAANSQAWNPSEKGFIDRPLMNHEGAGPWGVLWRPYHGDVRTVAGFFTKRNLWALCDIRNAIENLNVSEEIKDVLKLALASVIHPSSRQQRYYPGSTFPNMIMPGVLFFPAVHEEVNVYKRFFSKKRSLIRGQSSVNSRLGDGQTFIIQGSATDLDFIPTESIDYVFTDPPYSGRIQYGELLFLQEAILNFNTSWLSKELIVNEVRGIDLDLWAIKLGKCMNEVYRVLKPGCWASVCFHDSNPASWVKLQDVMLSVGFIPGPADRANSMHTGWQTLKMHTSEDITKRDLVVNFYKPRRDELGSELIVITELDDKATFQEKVELIIRDELIHQPGQKKDRIYDAVVARMVARGELEHHNFDEILAKVADEARDQVGFGRWYLKEDELEVIDAAETAKEDAAAQKIRSFIESHQRKYPGEEGVHYSDIFEHYVYTVKDKPRRIFTDFLPDYFYKTEQGTWRLPASEEEEEAKREARVKGLGRRVNRYIAQLEQGVIISDRDRPNDATLAEWVRHCKRAGFYDQGKFLYEKGGLNTDNLPEEAMVNVEEDYQVCVRMIARGAGGESPKKRKRKGE